MHKIVYKKPRGFDCYEHLAPVFGAPRLLRNKIQIQVRQPSIDLAGTGNAPLSVYRDIPAGIQKSRHGFINIAAAAGAEGDHQFPSKIITFQKRIHRRRRCMPPYCVSKLIQILHRCYRFYIYRKYRKINTFQKGRCTYACVAIVFLVGIAALSTFQSAKNNDSPFSDRLSLFLHSLK